MSDPMHDDARKAAMRIVDWDGRANINGEPINITVSSLLVKDALIVARALLASPSAALDEVLEEAATLIEKKHTNNVGMIHPMAMDDAKAIRSLQSASATEPSDDLKCGAGAAVSPTPEATAAALRAALIVLASAADDVGVKFFDTDTIDPVVERMQAATLAARALLDSPAKETK
jgi:hypothetical protein